MKNLLAFLGLLAFSWACGSESPVQRETTDPNQIAIQRVDRLFSELANEQVFFGSLAINKDGQLVYASATGKPNLEEKFNSNPRSKYRIASISKSFTAVLIFKAIEENRLALDQNIAAFFPDLDEAENITVAHLLHHQSGLKSYTIDDYFWKHRQEYQSPEALLEAISKLERHFKPGTETEYSNSNYFLLSQIIEKVYEKTYAEMLKTYILAPLKLQNTHLGLDAHFEPNECRSYKLEDSVWQEFPPTHLSLAFGSGHLLSTPQDLNVFFRSLLRGELLDSSSLAQMKTIVRRHGMGLFHYDIQGIQGFGHGGNIDAFESQAIYFPESDLAISLCTNASTKNMAEIYNEILKAYLGEKPVDISLEELRRYEGRYISTDDPEDLSVFEIENESLILVIKNEFRQPLVSLGNGKFLFNQLYGGSITFTFSEDGKELIFEQGNYRGEYRKE